MDIADADLDFHNYYVKELRQPNWTIPQKDDLSGSPPCRNFNRSYLPNG